MSGKTNPEHDLLYTPENEKPSRIIPIVEQPNKNLPKPFPNIDIGTPVEVQNKKPFLVGLSENERSLIVEEKKGGSLKYKKHHSYNINR